MYIVRPLQERERTRTRRNEYGAKWQTEAGCCCESNAYSEKKANLCAKDMGLLSDLSLK